MFTNIWHALLSKRNTLACHNMSVREPILVYVEMTQLLYT